MKIHLRFFAALCDHARIGERDLELIHPMTLREIFMGQFPPDLAVRLLPSVRFAVNCEYVSAESVVKDQDEIAFIPPVSGG